MIVKGLIVLAVVLSVPQVDRHKLRKLDLDGPTPPLSYMAYVGKPWKGKDSYYKNDWKRIRPLVKGVTAIDVILRYQNASLKDPNDPHKAFDWAVAMFTCADPNITNYGERDRYIPINEALANAKDPLEPEYERLRFLLEARLALKGQALHSLKVAGYKLIGLFPKDVLTPYYLIMAMVLDPDSLDEAETLAETQMHFHPDNYDLSLAWACVPAGRFYSFHKKEDFYEAERRAKLEHEQAPPNVDKKYAVAYESWTRLVERIKKDKGW
jgi:hypothetical protein